jgi:hypothetical protein
VIASRTINKLWSRVDEADLRYGDFASTHEALGVCCEEWTEFIDAVHANDAERIKRESLDLASALISLHDQIERGGAIIKRSGL